MASRKKEEELAKNWIREIFARKAARLLVSPFLDFTINFNNNYYEKTEPLRLQFNSENYFLNIYLFNPQFMDLWKKKEKRIIEEALDNQLNEIYLGQNLHREPIP